MAVFEPVRATIIDAGGREEHIRLMQGHIIATRRRLAGCQADPAVVPYVIAYLAAEPETGLALSGDDLVAAVEAYFMDHVYVEDDDVEDDDVEQEGGAPLAQ